MSTKLEKFFYSFLTKVEKLFNIFIKNKTLNPSIKNLDINLEGYSHQFKDFCELKKINYDVSSNHYKFIFKLEKEGFDPKNILEIGTFKGHTTNYLKELFPLSQIDTYDLPSNDPLLKKKDNNQIDPRRKTGFLSNVKDDDNTFLNLENINYYKKNTCHLFENNQKYYDLIWLDGSHSYPEVSWDIFFALSCLKSNGYLLVDDIYINQYYKKINFLDQIDAYEVIKYYNQRNLIRFNFFSKRKNSVDKKFIAYYHKQRN